MPRRLRHVIWRFLRERFSARADWNYGPDNQFTGYLDETPVHVQRKVSIILGKVTSLTSKVERLMNGLEKGRDSLDLQVDLINEIGKRLQTEPNWDPFQDQGLERYGRLQRDQMLLEGDHTGQLFGIRMSLLGLQTEAHEAGLACVKLRVNEGITLADRIDQTLDRIIIPR